MAFPEATALDAEARALLATLESAPDGAWSRPALGRWDLAALTAHVARGLERVSGAKPVDAAATIDRWSYFRQPMDAAAIAASAEDRAAGLADGERLADLRRAADGAADAMAAMPPGQVVEARFGPMRFDELVATRVLECAIHHMDAAACLEVPPVITPEAGRLASAICEALLDGPRPRAMGRARFLRAATGRITVDDPRFPVLS